MMVYYVNQFLNNEGFFEFRIFVTSRLYFKEKGAEGL